MRRGVMRIDMDMSMEELEEIAQVSEQDAAYTAVKAMIAKRLHKVMVLINDSYMDCLTAEMPAISRALKEDFGKLQLIQRGLTDEVERWGQTGAP